jgi:hypothetical protein
MSQFYEWCALRRPTDWVNRLYASRVNLRMPMSFWRNVGAWVALLWFLDFGAFIIAALHFGGDAWNGHAAGGRYFLSANGRLTEVSRAVFQYSRIHVDILLVHTAVTMVWAIRDKRSFERQ